MLYEMFSFISIIFNSFFIFILFITLNQYQFHTKKILAFTFMISFVIMPIYRYIGTATPVYLLLCILTYITGLSLIYHKGLTLKVFAVCLFYILGAISELCFYYIYVIAMEYSISEVQKSISLNTGPLLFTYFLTIILMFLFKNTKTFTQLYHQAKYPVVFVLTGVSPIVIIIIFFTFLKYLVDELNHEALILISICSVLLFLTLFLLFAGMYVRLLNQSIESKLNLEYANNIKALLTDLSEFKHDFNNMLNGFKGCVFKGNIEELREYCKEFEASFLAANNNIYNLGHIQNPAVLGVFLQKLEKIKTLKTDINILEDVAFETILDGASLCRVLGIILDNAIEAALSSEKMTLIIDILPDKTCTTIIIKNSFSGIIDWNHIHQSSKDVSRGTGLNSMERILSKHNSIIHNYYTDDSDYFTQQLVIPNKKMST